MRASLCSILTIVFLCTAVPCSAVDIETQMGFRYRAWSSDDDESGYQIYLPVYLRGARDQLSWGIVAGYAYTSGDLEGEDRSISGILDTQLNVAYTLKQIGGFDWLIGMDVNVPTGKTNRDFRDLRIMLDPDLVWIVSPGQGLNFNPFINLARRWNAWTFGLGAGYAFQGKYDYSTDYPDYDPGDILNVAAEILYAWQSGWQARFFGQYATFGKDELRGEDLLQRGDTVLVGAGLQYKQPAYALALTLQSINRSKTEYSQSAQTAIGADARNSYGNEWLADLGGRYKFSPATTAGATVSFLHIESNDDDQLYIGQRTKAALLLDIHHQLYERVQVQAGLEGFIIEDDPSWRHPLEDRSYRGWSISLSASTRF